MEDGLYISAYIAPPGSAPGENRSWVRHDQNMSAWLKRGTAVELVAVWEFERISGYKHHGVALKNKSAFHELLSELLHGVGLRISDVKDIWGTPGLGSGAHDVVATAVPDLPYHSRCHLLGGMLSDTRHFFEGRVLGLAVDDTPDSVVQRKPQNWYVGGYADHGSFELFPIPSPAKLYSAASRAFRMREGTLMALATASSARLAPDIGNPFTGLEIYSRHLADGRDADEEIARRLEQLVDQAGHEGLEDIDDRFSTADSIASAVMKAVQQTSVDLIAQTIERALDRFDIDPADTALAITGGYALNCPTNSAMMDRFGFATFLETPSVSDCGQSIGLALAQFLRRFPDGFSFQFPGAYLGGDTGRPEKMIAEFRPYISSVTPYAKETAVADLIRGPVAWVQGRSEVGPRALGHRSILADPRTPASRDMLNALKRRQWWRPVAPIVLADQMPTWFDGDRISPYMLQTFTVSPDRGHLIPAVAHLDRTARVQTVSPSDDVGLYELISAFAAQTGVPLLCNTSLNDHNEPIIETGAQAMNFCLRKGLSVLYLDDVRIEIDNHEAYPVRCPLPRRTSLFPTPTPGADHREDRR
ncbi:carbamoyltransferase C-terminal domain-containing protein [Sphaerimonospora thailandensis]|uniref:Carbamoyltransferase C-terminal domain-containing protein n=1 Tax=Sphaerimonospora thailandensis TaxID=795644 RepID=A0A8J3RCG1_9ACTN|nr:carbamoyltransferase C-terminal domain-containing protein [Sphaerimonospora thailandensis]GIH72060.1 hypothetical protein Mth01_43130 [Sphaerimonospora thailandensis]